MTNESKNMVDELSEIYEYCLHKTSDAKDQKIMFEATNLLFQACVEIIAANYSRKGIR